MSASQAADANRRITALAADRAVHRAFHWLHLHEAQLQRWHRELLAIPAPPFGEAPRAQWMLSRLRELGLINAHVDAEGNALAELSSANTVIQSEASRSDAKSKDRDAAHTTTTAHPFATSQATADEPVILLSAHLDTVFPAGTDCTPRERDGKLLCPGATDNGAGLTALLAIAAALRHAEINPACTILFAANVGEEGEGDLRGMRHLFSHSPYAKRIGAAIALEGCGNATVVDRALGSRRLRVEITGPGGHSWADAGRPSPITALAAALTALSRLALPANPRTTLNCGMISGGTSINSIPSTAQADLDLRSISSEELDSLETIVLSTLSKCVKEEARRGRTRDPQSSRETLPIREAPIREALQIKVRRIGDRAAGALASDSTLAASLRAVDRHLNLKTESRIGSTDANLPLSLGIPALAIGAGGNGGGIHTLDEWYAPDGRELALRRILLLLLDTCAHEISDRVAHPLTISS
ncbi:MAG TPA: M20/M25/M40 family metallo-hydrolase [Candidatus Aquilonibacter sp.]|nr:M20/M25/M40 family metallo-hydrolase [Candidatus Aquilonibacter sp.]